MGQAAALDDIAGRSIVESARALRQRLDEPKATVDLVTFMPDAEYREQVTLKALGLDEGTTFLEGVPFVVRRHAFSAVSSHRLEELRPLLVVCLLDGPEQAEALDKLAALSSDTTWLMVLHGGEGLPGGTKASLESQQTVVEEIGPNDLERISLPRRMQLPHFHTALNLLHNLSVSNALDRLETVIGLALDQQERSLKARRAMNQQQVIKVQGRRQGHAHDAASQLKQLLAQRIAELEAGLAGQVEARARPQTGAQSRMVDDLLEDLVGLTEVKRARNTIMAVPPPFEERFLDKIATRLRQDGLNDLIAMRDAMRSLEQDMAKAAERCELPSPTLQIQLLTDQPLQELVANVVHLERRYEGSMVRKGSYEFFMAIRKYQMIVFMMLSTLGLSLMRELRFIMVPLTLLLLGLGAVFVVRSMRREREESGETELKKAREMLRGEARRMLADVARQWSRLLNDHLRTIQSTNAQTMDGFLKDLARKQAENEEEEKRRVQLLVQKNDQQERRCAELRRAHQNLQRTLGRLRNDLHQTFARQARHLFA